MSTKKAPETQPYRNLGYQLRSIREKHKESIDDVSGAVEIDAEALDNIEKGFHLPAEDILLLLISHFGLKNEEAMKLWRLAGYDRLFDDSNSVTDLIGQAEITTSQQAAIFVLPIDSRVVYTDLTQVTANDRGIILNFLQTNPQNSQNPISVSKVGMSKEHVQNLIDTLRSAIKKDVEPKRLNQAQPNSKRPKDSGNI